MGVDRHSFFAQGQVQLGMRVDHLGVDDVLPQVHAAVQVPATRGAHPGSHLGHGALVDDITAEGLLDQAAGGGDAGPGLP